MRDEKRGERLQIMLTKGELKEVDDWRFRKCMPSRAAAFRELLIRGLDADRANRASQSDKTNIER